MDIIKLVNPMAFSSAFRRILGTPSTLSSHFASLRFNSTLTTSKLFVSGKFAYLTLRVCVYIHIHIISLYIYAFVDNMNLLCSNVRLIFIFCLLLYVYLVRQALDAQYSFPNQLSRVRK